MHHWWSGAPLLLFSCLCIFSFKFGPLIEMPSIYRQTRARWNKIRAVGTGQSLRVPQYFHSYTGHLYVLKNVTEITAKFYVMEFKSVYSVKVISWSRPMIEDQRPNVFETWTIEVWFLRMSKAAADTAIIAVFDCKSRYSSSGLIFELLSGLDDKDKHASTYCSFSVTSSRSLGAGKQDRWEEITGENC